MTTGFGRFHPLQNYITGTPKKQITQRKAQHTKKRLQKSTTHEKPETHKDHKKTTTAQTDKKA